MLHQANENRTEMFHGVAEEVGSAVRCRRCAGLMVASDVVGVEGEMAIDLFQVWRCVNCGELIDLQILANRLGRRAGVLPAAP